MSTIRGRGVGGGVREVVQRLKEIVNRPEQEIYTALKECNMDPDDAVLRLLSQDPFQDVKRKRLEKEKKKEEKACCLHCILSP